MSQLHVTYALLMLRAKQYLPYCLHCGRAQTLKFGIYPQQGGPTTLGRVPIVRRYITNWSLASSSKQGSYTWLSFSSLMSCSFHPVKTEHVHLLSKVFSCPYRSHSESQSSNSLTYLLCQQGPQTFTATIGRKMWKQNQPVRYLSHVKTKMKYVHWQSDTHPSTQKFHYLILQL